MEKELRLWELRGKLVFVSRKTRAKFPNDNVGAPGGAVYLVVTTWESPWTHTEKMIVVNKDGEQFGTTSKCIELIETPLNRQWQKLKDTWDEENSIPVVARCIDIGRIGPKGNRPRGAFFKLLNGKSFTITRKSVSKWPDNIEIGKVMTVWLPIWKAKRLGLV